MKGSRAAIRYAKAALGHAFDLKASAEVDNDMRQFLKTLQDSDDLQALLSSPVATDQQKESVLMEVFKKAHPVSLQLLKLLVNNNRVELLGQVAEQYIQKYDEHQNRVVATVITAVPLNDKLEAQLLQKVAEITGKKITLNNQIDPSILGGFVLRVGDKQFNASISNKLQTLKRSFTTNTKASIL